MKIAAYLPNKDSGAGQIIQKIYCAFHQYAKDKYSDVEICEVRPGTKCCDDIVAGIAFGDEAVRMMPNLGRRSSAPILALTGLARGEGLIYPLLPTPRFSGYLFARAMLPQVRARLAVSQKKVRIAVVSLLDSDDPYGVRFESFKQMLDGSRLSSVPDIQPVSVSSEDIASGTVPCLSRDGSDAYDFVAIYGYGNNYTPWVDALANAYPQTTFWVDYNYEWNSENATARRDDGGRRNLNTLCLKNCRGVDVFIRLVCVALDIFHHGIGVIGRDAEKSLNGWLTHLRYLASDIGPILFLPDAHIPCFPFYCVEGGGVERPVDYYGQDRTIVDIEIAEVLSTVDALAHAWKKTDSDERMLLGDVVEVLRKSFPATHVGFAFGSERASYGTSEEMDDKVVTFMRTISLLQGTGNVRQDAITQVNLDAWDAQNNGVNRVFVVGNKVLGGEAFVSPIVFGVSGYCEYDLAVGPSAISVVKRLGLHGKKTGIDTLKHLENHGCEAVVQYEKLCKNYRETETRYLYFYNLKNVLGCGGSSEWMAYVGSTEKMHAFDLEMSFDIIKSTLSHILNRQARKAICIASVKSAIGSIMSRNGSHNIGSHVLAALSHNVGTMPDDRVLYQYIQHRMDYIATVTTDFPAWSQPTMFVGGMIKNFLTQRHLLNHIAGSEGLKAWQYQNQNIGKQSACIRLHVRRIKGDVCDDDRKVVADFFADSVSAIKLEQDVCLAIPGGVVGQHAFFTIIENLIRNAAKHDWSTPPESTKEFKYQRRKQRRKLGDADSDADAMDLRGHPDTEIYETESVDGREVLKVVGNLDVYIDFEDKPEEGNVEFTVYTNMSDAEVAPGSGGQSLVQSIQASLDEPIIDNETGMLRRTNWGLAEMKISCGYLQRREIGEIGGLAGKSDRADKNEDRFGPILTACAVKINREDTVKHLGYRFKVPKPRTLLLITQNEVAPETKKKFPKLAEYGVYVKSMCRQSDKNVGAVNKEELGAEFVLLDSFETECYSWKLPFRVIAMKYDDSEPKNLIAKWNCGGYAFSGILARKTTVDEVIDFVANGDDEHGDMESRTKEVIAHVAACWTRYVCKRRCPNLDSEQKVNLVVVPTTKSGSGEQGAGRSLVNPASVASYVFDEGFDTVVSSYEHLHGIGSGSSGEKAACYSALEHLRKLKPRVVNAEYRKSDWGYEEVVQRQLEDWLKNLNADKVGCREVADYLELKLKEKSQEDLKDIKRSLEEVVARIDAGERSPDLLATKKSLILKRNELIGRAHETAREAHHYFATFVAYFIEVCKQAKVYLGKYAEDVATVPQSFKNLNNVGGKDREVETSQRWEAGGLTFYRTEQIESKAGDVTIEYIRHFTESEGVVREPGTEPKFVTDPFSAHPCVKYIEALSGTQSYLSQLQMMRYDDYIMQAKLMENALLRILIIDERVAKFISDHSDVMLATYSRLNLTVVDDKWMDDALKLDENSCAMGWTPRGLRTLNVSAIKALNKKLLELEKPEEFKGFQCAFDRGDCDWFVKSYSEQFDILIVHQGIIDKWFPDVAHDPNRVTWLYRALKKLFPYVIITTGRGTPANIPDWARVLPFSTIESTLFKKYPEKLLLVDAIMNILPLSKS